MKNACMKNHSREARVSKTCLASKAKRERAKILRQLLEKRSLLSKLVGHEYKWLAEKAA